jgi:hypothetical protein
MHTKINTHQNDPNFLTHVIMVRNEPRDAAYTPRTIMKLNLCNYKEKQEYFKNKYL